MHRIVTNRFRYQYNGRVKNLPTPHDEPGIISKEYVPRNAKLLAWGILIFLFIENGTLGLLPSQFYMVYRNVRISDLILYFLIAYSLYCAGEYKELLKSKALIITNILLAYIFLRFLASVITYQQNLIEYFFRLKFLWESFLVFPFLLLLKRNGLNYLIKIILPFAIVSNILYIISAVTGVALMPNTSVYKQELPGGLEVYRVYGGTFHGEIYFLGLIFFMITRKFKISYLALAILFIIPHILAFGRSAWIALIFDITLILIYNVLKKRGFKVLVRQLILMLFMLGALFYVFSLVIPQPGYMVEALQNRVIQGQEDIKYSEGTYGTRVTNIEPLLELWRNNSVLFGIGMHPFWVIKPETNEEEIYQWGYYDLVWAPVLTTYGLVGFILIIIFEIYYLYISFKIIKKSAKPDLYVFFGIGIIATFFYTGIIAYSVALLSVTIYGPGYVLSFYITIVVYQYTKLKELNNENSLH